jgi:general L-amino acid transport system substrate-binding protein
VITQVGNYGEIFDRTSVPTPRWAWSAASNDLWTDGGLLYAPPYR